MAVLQSGNKAKQLGEPFVFIGWSYAMNFVQGPVQKALDWGFEDVSYLYD